MQSVWDVVVYLLYSLVKCIKKEQQKEEVRNKKPNEYSSEAHFAKN